MTKANANRAGICFVALLTSLSTKTEKKKTMKSFENYVLIGYTSIQIKLKIFTRIRFTTKTRESGLSYVVAVITRGFGLRLRSCPLWRIGFLGGRVLAVLTVVVVVVVFVIVVVNGNTCRLVVEKRTVCLSKLR